MIANRLRKIKKIRNKLQHSIPSIGSWMQISNSNVAEIFGDLGYDWVAIDLEHSQFELEKIPDIFRSLELGNTLPIVRLPNIDEEKARSFLEIGCGGLIIPMIENKDQLQRIISACNFIPKGNRGVGFNRSNLYGKNLDQYIKFSSRPLIVAQIETFTAFENIEEILSVKGLDAIFIGPYDLSSSMNITGQFDSQRFKKVINEIISKCKKYKVASGIHIVNPDLKLLKKNINLGFSFLAYSIDTVILNLYAKNPLNSLEK